MIDTIKTISNFLWDNMVVYLLLIVGLFYTVKLGFPQFTKLGKGFKEAFKNIFLKDGREKDHVSSFQALTVSLAAQIGTGNISGIASAIMVGGPGAIFWMWISGILGMGTIFGEAVLAQTYREKKGDEVYGGPAYYLSKGMKNKKFGKILASIFAILIVISLGIVGNMVQSNSISTSMSEGFGIKPILTGIVLAALVAIIIAGGIKRISKVAELIVPVMILIYIGVGVVILAKFSNEIIPALKSIFTSAFSAKAALGGAIGISVKEAVRLGIQKGLFSNEAGMGATPQANAIAEVDHPVKQGLVAMVSVVIDTIIISTITALIILVTNAHTALDTTMNPITVTQKGFELALGETGTAFLGILLLFFAYTTMIGWYYYGESNIVYLFGKKAVIPYKILVVLAVIFGTVTHFNSIWTMSDLLNALMVIPNWIGIMLMSNIVVNKYKEWKSLELK